VFHVKRLSCWELTKPHDARSGLFTIIVLYGAAARNLSERPKSKSNGITSSAILRSIETPNDKVDAAVGQASMDCTLSDQGVQSTPLPSTICCGFCGMFQDLGGAVVSPFDSTDSFEFEDLGYFVFLSAIILRVRDRSLEASDFIPQS